MLGTSHFTAEAVSRATAARTLMGFDVIARVGEGAGSMLYSVVDPVTRRSYALKCVRPRTDKDQGFVEQLRTEFEVGRRGRHPGLRGEVELQLRRTLLGTVVPRLETVLHLLNRRAERSTAARVLVA